MERECMNIFSTPVHTIPKDKVLSISFAADDKNPHLCALQFHLITGITITPIFASRQELLKLLKKHISERWNDERVFDFEVELVTLEEKAKEFYDKPIFYNFISEEQLISDVARFKSQGAGL